MKFLRYLLPTAVVVCGFTTSAAFASCAPCSSETVHNESLRRDFEAVQEFVNSKRTITLEEKDCNLSISGDIRFNWAHRSEKLCGHQLLGRDGFAKQIEHDSCFETIYCGRHNGSSTESQESENGCCKGVPFSKNPFNVEFNLYFDYTCDRAWGVAWLQFHNDAGIQHINKTCRDENHCRDGGLMFGSGCCEALCLKKAYMGYNVCTDGCSRFDVELGRRPLYTVFDSRIQFQNRFDGLLLKYNRSIECWGDFYVNLGAFVVDERADHYAWVTELGLLNVYDCGVDVKYSFIDWKSFLSHDENRCGTKDPRGADFRNSQFTVAYRFNPDYLCMPTKIYGAFLWNHAAEKARARSFCCDENGRGKDKENLAWYLGFIIGEVCREGDWSVDVNYQQVQAQAIPDSDISGISNGNVLGAHFASDGLGRGNYKGARIEALYALTDNLSLDANIEFSKADDKKFGGKHTYSKFELEAIYAF